MVAAVPLAGLAVPGPRSAVADHRAPAQSRLPHGRRCRRARLLGVAAYAATLVCDASSGAQHRRARDPGSARARQAGYDRALHAGREQSAAVGREPARFPATTEATAAGLVGAP